MCDAVTKGKTDNASKVSTGRISLKEQLEEKKRRTENILHKSARLEELITKHPVLVDIEEFFNLKTEIGLF